MPGKAKLPADLQAARDAALALVDVVIRIASCTHPLLPLLGNSWAESVTGPDGNPQLVLHESEPAWWLAVREFDDAWQRAQERIGPVQEQLRSAQSGRVKCGSLIDTSFKVLLDVGSRLDSDLTHVLYEPPPGAPAPPWGNRSRDERLRDVIQSWGLDNTDWNDLRSALTLDAEQAAGRRPVECEAERTEPRAVRPKKSHQCGDGRAKLIAELTRHHKYADGGCLNTEPIGNNELARRAEVDPSTASAFFNKEFSKGEKGGHLAYQLRCRNAGLLSLSLKALNDEFSPNDFQFGRNVPGEGGDDEDD